MDFVTDITWFDLLFCSAGMFWLGIEVGRMIEDSRFGK
jgi:hypothetical protein